MPEKAPAAKFTVSLPVLNKLSEEIQDPDCELTTGEPEFVIVARSILSCPEEFEVTEPMRIGTVKP